MTDKIQRMHRASQILEDEIFVDAIGRAEAHYVEQWKGGKTTADREEAHHRLQALQRVLTDLQIIMQEGEYVEAMAKRKPYALPSKQKGD